MLRPPSCHKKFEGDWAYRVMQGFALRAVVTHVVGSPHTGVPGWPTCWGGGQSDPHPQTRGTASPIPRFRRTIILKFRVCRSMFDARGRVRVKDGFGLILVIGLGFR